MSESTAEKKPNGRARALALIEAPLQVVTFEDVMAQLSSPPPGAEETARDRCERGLYETETIRREARICGFDISAWTDWQIWLVHAAFTIGGAGSQRWVLVALASAQRSKKQA